MSDVDPLSHLVSHEVASRVGRLFLYWLQGMRGSINTKANKVIGAVEGNLASLTADGDLADSGKAPPEGDIVGTTDMQTLTNKTLIEAILTQPYIADFTNAVHNHDALATGGAEINGIQTGNLVDKTAAEIITGAWQFQDMPVTEYTDLTVTLGASDFGAAHVFDNGADSAVCNLMSIAEANKGQPLWISQLGTGELKVQAADSDYIGPSSAGGYFKSSAAHNFSTRKGSTLGLVVLDDDYWGFIRGGNYGMWDVY